MFEDLKNELKGELYFGTEALDEAIKAIYATDASVYQEKPIAVALPKDENDIKKIVAFANKFSITLIPRAAGTSLAGQVVGAGLVVDISKFMNGILELNLDEKWVRVQPGVIRDDLNAYLKPFGLMFGPETSTASRAMIGGMIGNNSCGLHSIIWGTTRDNLLEVKAILADASVVIFSRLGNNEWIQKLALTSFEGEIYQKLEKLLSKSENQQAIVEGFPKNTIRRRNTGYALDTLLEKNSRNIASLVAGSEGTLCVITEAKLQLIDLPPAFSGMVAVHTRSMNEALIANLVALEHHCTASELVDDFILDFTKTNIEQAKNRFFIEGEPKAILMVEFFDDTESGFYQKTDALISALKTKDLGYAFPILLGDDAKKAWDVRKGGLGLLRNLKGDIQPVNLIEDCAVSPEDLPKYIQELEDLLQNKKVQYSIYAHAGAGELHVEPMINLKTSAGRLLFREILAETAVLVKKYGGSLSGEHGDGRLRGEFIPFMMGEKNYDLFKQTKEIFDPVGIFNYGKIVNSPPMNEFLRFEADVIPPAQSTVFDFSEQESLLRLAEKCSGSGDCRKTEITGGTMCPSYMATRFEKDTTRARANVLRQFYTDKNTISDVAVKEVLDLCLSCKACKSECPSSVDVAKMKAEFLQESYHKNGIPFRTKLIGNFSKQMKLASKVPWAYQVFFGTEWTRKILNKVVGFHPKRSMPHLYSETLEKWYHRQSVYSKFPNGKVVLFCDEFTNYNDVEVGKKTMQLLWKLGYDAQIIRHFESGRSYLSKGMLHQAKELAEKNVAIFAEIISEKVPLIGIEPSAILTFRDEYQDLLSGEWKEKAKEIAKNTYTFEEWFAGEIDKKNIKKEAFSLEKKLIKLHGHCHQKALSSLTPSKKCLSFPQNYEVHLIPSGCCGMAGSFGYEEEHYETSMKIGELVLFPTIRKQSKEVLIAAAGTSCRHQIKDGTARESKHPAEILFEALV